MTAALHYNGRLDDPATLPELLDAVRLFAASQRWPAREVEDSIIGRLYTDESLSPGPADDLSLRGVDDVLSLRGASDGTVVVPSDATRQSQRESSQQRASSIREGASSPLAPLDELVVGLLLLPDPSGDPIFLTFNRSGQLVYYRPVGDDEYQAQTTLYALAPTQGAHVALCDLFHELQDSYMPGLNVYDESGYFDSNDLAALDRAWDALAPLPNTTSDDATSPDTPPPFRLPRPARRPRPTPQIPPPRRSPSSRRHG